jgi:serine/threonine protein kinase
VDDVQENELVKGYTLHCVLGRSQWATVFLVTNAAGERCAAKRMLKDTVLFHWDFIESQRVITMLTSLQHSKTVTVRHVIDDHSLPYLFVMMQYVRRGSAGKMDGDGFCYPCRQPKKLLTMLQSALSGLAYLHGQGIAHGDIKPENLLMLDDEHVALTDVVMSRLSCRRPSFFSAPETLETPGPHTATFEADVWALGVSFYALLVGHVPFVAVPRDAVGLAIKYSPLATAYPPETPAMLKATLERMMTPNAKCRCTPQDLLYLVESTE